MCWTMCIEKSSSESRSIGGETATSTVTSPATKSGRAPAALGALAASYRTPAPAEPVEHGADDDQDDRRPQQHRASPQTR